MPSRSVIRDFLLTYKNVKKEVILTCPVRRSCFIFQIIKLLRVNSGRDCHLFD